MKKIFSNLSWLLPPPNNLNNKIFKAKVLEDLQKISKYSLNSLQYYNVFKKKINLNNKNSNFKKINLGIITNSNFSLTFPFIITTALRYGIDLKIIESNFNNISTDVFYNNSIFGNQKLDYILLAIDYSGFPINTDIANEKKSYQSLKECKQYLNNIIDKLKEKTSSHIILQNLVFPLDNIFGSYDAKKIGSLYWYIENLNIYINNLKLNGISLLDINSLSRNVGLENWYNPKLYNIAKISFDETYNPIYSEYLNRVIAAQIGKSKRCLIVDLDNTLWGGVIGDDGLDGIKLGKGDPVGEAYLKIQEYILKLKKRGIIIAVCSKNSENLAIEPFKKHPEMILKEDDIAIFVANWKDKPSNIKYIAETLSIGLESCVFFDDNPAERMHVREKLPEVAVPELPNDAEFYLSTLFAAGYFETTNFSTEDIGRADYYKKNYLRKKLLTKNSNINDYLKKLKMKIFFKKFDKLGRARILQLISKSNQFNLTTKRYNEEEIKRIEKNQDYFTRQIRLEDIFGDNGMISVLICKKISKATWEIDTWLMSCRVLGRKVEEAVLYDLVNIAKKNNIKKIFGTYVPTLRNIIVKNHYKDLNFKFLKKNNGVEFWELDIKNYKKKILPMKFH